MLSETWRSACDDDTIGRCQRSFDCFFCFLFSRYWDANVSHINAVSHSAPGVSGHVCEHTPTLCAQCTHCGLILACSVVDSGEIIAPNSTDV